ncbi:MAG: hypothetical protein V5A84_00550 [Planctomycetota bacterium]
MGKASLQQEPQPRQEQELKQEEKLDLDQRLRLLGPQTVGVESDFGVVITSKEGLIEKSRVRRVIFAACPKSKHRHSHITFREQMVDTLDMRGEDASNEADKVTVAAKLDLNEVEEEKPHPLLQAETWYTFLPAIMGYGLTKEVFERFFQWAMQATGAIAGLAGFAGAMLGGVFGRFIGKNISAAIENAITGLKNKLSEDNRYNLNVVPETLRKVGIRDYIPDKPLLNVGRTRLPREAGEPVHYHYHFGGPEFMRSLLQDAFPDRPELDVDKMELSVLFLTYEAHMKELEGVLNAFEREYGDRPRRAVGCGCEFPIHPVLEDHVLRVEENINFRASLSFNTVVSFNFEEGEEADLSYCQGQGNEAPCIIVCANYDRGTEIIDYTAHYLPGRYETVADGKKRFRLIGGEEYEEMGTYRLTKEGPVKVSDENTHAR